MKKLIQWARAQYWDKPWNPIVGCRPCSPACENCYAKALWGRFARSARFEIRDCTFNWTKKYMPPTKKVVFCGNMTDLFGEWLNIQDSIDYIGKTLGHSDKATYLWCTKRAGRMREALARGEALLKDESEPDGVDLFPFRDCEMSNQYFGFTAENQEWFENRQQATREMPTFANLWYSCEPLLGPIYFGAGIVRSNLRWVVVGCESGQNRRPCKIEWVESIVEQCFSAGVPVFVKQLDIDGKCERDITNFPAHLQIRQVPWATKKEGA